MDFKFANRKLARISHKLPAAGGDMPVIAALLPAMSPAMCLKHASATSWSKAHTGRHLRALATKVCEKSRLKRLFTEERGAKRYPPEVVDAFFDVMGLIEAAVSEQDLRDLKHLHLEKLKGSRRHQRSLVLHGKWRLIVELHEAEDRKTGRIS